jgi:hypothetical protein
MLRTIHTNKNQKKQTPDHLTSPVTTKPLAHAESTSSTPLSPRTEVRRGFVPEAAVRSMVIILYTAV